MTRRDLKSTSSLLGLALQSAKPIALLVTLMVHSAIASAATMVEDFEAPFPAWESGFLGTNSNLQNYYGDNSGSRGNNPDGLWISDGDGGEGDLNIVFTTAFGATLTSLSLDVAGFAPVGFEIYDKDGNSLFKEPSIALTLGAFTDPGIYVRYSASSNNGIGGFRFIGSSAEGNTSIDNVQVTTSPVPLPPTVWLLVPTLAGLAMVRRRTI